MNKLLRVAALFLLILLLLTGCKGNEPEAYEEPTASPTPTATPTMRQATLEPTITPRIFEGEIEEPTAGATPLLIYPVDLPPISFTYEEVSVPKLNINFELPVGWVDISSDDDPNRVTFQEPMTTVQAGFRVQSLVQISVYQMQSVQTTKNAEDELNRQVDLLKEEFPGIRITGMSNSRLMKEMGRYISYWVEYPYDETDEKGEPKTHSMRGRLHVTPIDRKLYIIRTMHPADFNAEYDEIYKRVRESLSDSTS